MIHNSLRNSRQIECRAIIELQGVDGIGAGEPVIQHDRIAAPWQGDTQIHAGLAERQIALRNALPKTQNIGSVAIADLIFSVAQIEHISIVAHPSPQDVVARPACKDIIARATV